MAAEATAAATAVVVDGGGGIGERGIEREERGRERTQGWRVLETVAAVLPDQFRWTADTNCFSGLNRAVLSLLVPSLRLRRSVLLAPAAQHPRLARGSILSFGVRPFVASFVRSFVRLVRLFSSIFPLLLFSLYPFVLTAILSPIARRTACPRIVLSFVCVSLSLADVSVRCPLEITTMTTPTRISCCLSRFSYSKIYNTILKRILL